MESQSAVLIFIAGIVAMIVIGIGIMLIRDQLSAKARKRWAASFFAVLSLSFVLLAYQHYRKEGFSNGTLFQFFQAVLWGVVYVVLYGKKSKSTK